MREMAKELGLTDPMEADPTKDAPSKLDLSKVVVSTR